MKILVIKVNQLGDNVVHFPVIQHLVKEYGTDSVAVMTSPLASGIYENFLHDSHIYRYPTEAFNKAWKTPGLLIRVIQEARAFKPDVVIIPFDQGNVAYLVAKLSGAKKVIASANPGVKLNFLATHRFESDELLPVAERDWNLLALAFSTIGKELKIDKPEKHDWSHLLDGKELVRNGVIIHAGASREYKRWPIARFVELANRLSSEGVRVKWCLQGLDVESDLIDEVEKLPQRSLREFINTVNAAEVMVGNNSGPMNIANALSVSLVVMNGPSPDRWDPYWDRENVLIMKNKELACRPCETMAGPLPACPNLSEPMACLKRWTVEDVYNQVKKKLR